mgnify:CR=1 FL=1
MRDAPAFLRCVALVGEDAGSGSGRGLEAESPRLLSVQTGEHHGGVAGGLGRSRQP